MNLAVISAFAIVILFFIGSKIFTSAPAGRMRSSMIAQTGAVCVFSLLRILQLETIQRGYSWDLRLLSMIGNLSGALGATLGIAIVSYIRFGRWQRRYYALSFLALLPRYGETISAALWMVIPWIVRDINRSKDAESRVMTHSIFTGTIAGGLLSLCLIPAHLFRGLGVERLGIEIVGPLVSTLFLYAGLHARRDPENEFCYHEIRSLVKNGVMILIPVSVLPAFFLKARDFVIFERFFIPACIVASGIFIVILMFHFEARGIKTFLMLLLVSLLPSAVSHLYSERLDASTLLGMRLFSRLALVMSCLFILKQYLRWGFEIVQTMVMIITAIATASIVFLIIYLAQPFPEMSGSFGGAGSSGFPHEQMVMYTIVLLDIVVLGSLPPILVNYGFGTMKVTWAILSFGLFFENFIDFLPIAGSPCERDIVSLLAYGLIALAFCTLWRYTSAMMRDIRTVSGSLDSA